MACKEFSPTTTIEEFKDTGSRRLQMEEDDGEGDGQEEDDNTTHNTKTIQIEGVESTTSELTETISMKDENMVKENKKVYNFNFPTQNDLGNSDNNLQGYVVMDLMYKDSAIISKEETHEIIQMINSNPESTIFDTNSFETTEEINLIADPDDEEAV